MNVILLNLTFALEFRRNSKSERNSNFTLERHLIYSSVDEDVKMLLIHRYACSAKDTVLLHFLEILKRMLQNF